jgi:hypothetical protein
MGLLRLWWVIEELVPDGLWERIFGRFDDATWFVVLPRARQGQHARRRAAHLDEWRARGW